MPPVLKGACLDEAAPAAMHLQARTTVIKQWAAPGLPLLARSRRLKHSSDISDNVVVIASDQVATADDHVNSGSASADASAWPRRP